MMAKGKLSMHTIRKPSQPFIAEQKQAFSKSSKSKTATKSRKRNEEVPKYEIIKEPPEADCPDFLVYQIQLPKCVSSLHQIFDSSVLLTLFFRHILKIPF
jgi:hypothetical protein